MATVGQALFNLPTNSSVKWLTTQERNLNRELLYPDPAAETPEEYVFRTYLQFLWLPQKYHTRIPELLAEETEPADSEEEYVWYAYHKDKVAGEDEQPQDGQAEYEAQERLKHAWLEKFERREVQIQILLHLLLISLPGERTASELSEDARAAIAEALPLPPSLSPSKSKKRKRKAARESARAPAPPPQSLEERLESYMDKLAMWQLMHAVDDTLSRGDGPKRAADERNDRRKDGRDWMQAFCEDVVEPLFKEKLPDLCSLFRSKLFADAGGADTDPPVISPPLSPKPAAKRARPSGSTRSTASTSTTSTSKDAEQRARSRSLSHSLEQEKRERSRSLGLGAQALRKRATVYEVTMTTKFSKKPAPLARTASVPAPAPGPSLARTQSRQHVGGGRDARRLEREKSAMGTVLVEATPVKPRTELSRTQSQKAQSQAQARLPSLFSASASGSGSQDRAHFQVQPSQLSRADSVGMDTEEESDDERDGFGTPTKARRQRTLSFLSEDGGGDEWRLDSTPDILPLGESQEGPSSEEDEGPPVSSSPGELGGFGEPSTPVRGGTGRGRVLVGKTPTKAR